MNECCTLDQWKEAEWQSMMGSVDPGDVLTTHLEETSYLLWMTLQGIPATRTEFWMSSARWPRLEPEMVTTVPPSTGPETGSNLKRGKSGKKAGKILFTFSPPSF